MQDASSTGKKVFTSPLAGSWYSRGRDRLNTDIEGFFNEVKQDPVENIQALILPHAGYRYSGRTAAFGVKPLAGRRFSRVVVIGPSHRIPMRNAASVPGFTHYASPLGEMPLDRDFITALKKSSFFQTIPEAHEVEHSVQIELPLLQKALGEFRLVPIVVGSLDLATTREMGKILAALIDENTLVVASSDFTHFGNRFGYTPFQDDIPERLKTLDLGAYEKIRAKDLEGFFRYIEDTGATICGRHSIGLLLAMLPEGAEARLLKYDTSGRITGDYSNSVSYLSAAFLGSWPAQQKKVEHAASPKGSLLSPEDRKQLLRLARGTLTHFLKMGEQPKPSDLAVEITAGMREIMGAFVTLKKDGELRGCIGEIFPKRALFEAVMNQAVNAGLHDRRFPRVKARELSRIRFEISALTPPVSVASYNEIILGRHGVILEKDGRRAVFLPQVATEQGWDIPQTLTHLSRKAGLPGDAWKEGASFTVFEAVVFGEGDA